jgi:hypothetical protein
VIGVFDEMRSNKKAQKYVTAVFSVVTRKWITYDGAKIMEQVYRYDMINKKPVNKSPQVLKFYKIHSFLSQQNCCGVAAIN